MKVVGCRLAAGWLMALLMLAHLTLSEQSVHVQLELPVGARHVEHFRGSVWRSIGQRGPNCSC